MKIMKLGPIKQLDISLDRLNLFVGQNGTGKTIAAYAIYSFVEWLVNQYEPHILDRMQLDQLVKEQQLVLPYKEVVDAISGEVTDHFNQLPSEYFSTFFKGKGIYTPTESHIEVEKADVLAVLQTIFVFKGRRSLRWEYRVPDELMNEAQSGENQLQLAVQDREWILNYYSPDVSSEDIVSIRYQQFRWLFGHEVRGLNKMFQKLLLHSKVAYLPAERIGIDVFRTDLNLSRLNRFNEWVRGNQLAANAKKVYPQPIEDYISFLNNTLRLDTQKRETTWQPALRLMQSLVPGQFVYQTETDTLGYQLPNQEGVVDFELLSSSLKSNLGLELFLRHGEQGDWLFVDEPEMNLHPANQVKMAELQYQLLKLGVGQVISTHSDYYLKALINVVLADRLAGNDQAKQIAVYEFTNDGVRPLPNLFNDSINDSFDDVTNAINDRYYDLMEQLTDKEE